jgi:hypothetical protein
VYGTTRVRHDGGDSWCQKIRTSFGIFPSAAKPCRELRALGGDLKVRKERGRGGELSGRYWYPYSGPSGGEDGLCCMAGAGMNKLCWMPSF